MKCMCYYIGASLNVNDAIFSMGAVLTILSKIYMGGRKKKFFFENNFILGCLQCLLDS